MNKLELVRFQDVDQVADVKFDETVKAVEFLILTQFFETLNDDVGASIHDLDIFVFDGVQVELDH